MKRYVFGRIIRSIISVLAVCALVIIAIYSFIPRSKIFENDGTINKLMGKDDELAAYKYGKWEELGYLDFVRQTDLCADSEDYDACMVVDSEESIALKEQYEAEGYTFEYFSTGLYYGYRDYTSLELVWNFLTTFIHIDTPSYVEDESNPDLERSIYLATDHNGRPAIKCSGCEHEYLLYFDGSFPFIHQNFISFDFGYSYPTNSGIKTMDVITSGQGERVMTEVTFETGYTSNSAVNLYSCKYKTSSTLDHMDTQKFSDNYADCDNNYSDPSMMATSFYIGVLAVILGYAIALPAGIYMARKKDKWQDKVGLVYINLMISVPSLAFIFFLKQIGLSFGLPDKFPQLGFDDIRSWILPVVIMALMNTASIMIWIRRYMVDQSNADYVKFARAKGLSEKEIFNNHILRNAIIPIVNGIPGSIVGTISGAVITESVFAIPGMGKMLPDSIKVLNNRMILTLAFIFSALSIFSLLVGDLLITVVDPRIQLTSKGETR